LNVENDRTIFVSTCVTKWKALIKKLFPIFKVIRVCVCVYKTQINVQDLIYI